MINTVGLSSIMVSQSILVYHVRWLNGTNNKRRVSYVKAHIQSPTNQ